MVFTHGMANGRPSKYKPQYCEELIAYMSSGGSLEGFAGLIPVNRQTIYNWLERHQDFHDAYGIAQSKACHWWEQLLLQNLVSEKGGPQFNTTAWIFTMKNRFGWRDKHEESEQRPSADPELVKMALEMHKKLMDGEK